VGGLTQTPAGTPSTEMVAVMSTVTSAATTPVPVTWSVTDAVT
jgi:hypothetical protein